MIGVRWVDFTRGDDFQVATLADIPTAMAERGVSDAHAEWIAGVWSVVTRSGESFRAVAVLLVPLRAVVGVEDNPGGLFPSLRLACGHRVAMLNPWKPATVRCWACAEGRLT